MYKIFLKINHTYSHLWLIFINDFFGVSYTIAMYSIITLFIVKFFFSFSWYSIVIGEIYYLYYLSIYLLLLLYFINTAMAFESPQFDQRGSLLQSCSTGAKTFTNNVFCHPQFSGVIHNIENRCAILTPICLCRLLSK